METNKRKGISLIVLVITIIMIILAAAIILSLSNSGIIGRAKEAKIKNDMKSMQEELNLKVANMELNGEDMTTLNNQDASEVITSAKKYDGMFTISYGKLYISPSATEEEIKCAKEVGIDVDDRYIYDKLAFDFATNDDGWDKTGTRVIEYEGKLSVTLPEETEYEYFYKENVNDEFTALTNEFSIDNWKYSLDYTSGLETESKIYLGYRRKGESNINSREFSYSQLVIPDASVSIDEATNDIKIDFGKTPVHNYEYLLINMPYCDGLHTWNYLDYNGEYNYYQKTSDINDATYIANNFLSRIAYRDSLGEDGDGYRYFKVNIFLSNDTDFAAKNIKPIESFVVEVKVSDKIITKWPKKALYDITYVDSTDRAKLINDRDISWERRIYDPELVAFTGIGTSSISETLWYGNWKNSSLKELINEYFDGWYYDSEFKNKAVMGEQLTKDITLYAKWKK